MRPDQYELDLVLRCFSNQLPQELYDQLALADRWRKHLQGQVPAEGSEDGRETATDMLLNLPRAGGNQCQHCW